MKLFPVEQLRQWDQRTISEQYESSTALMEVAAKACAEKLVSKAPSPLYVFFCGTGNNGGDGLVMARMLTEQDLQVVVLVVGDPAKGSNDFRANLQLSIHGDLPLKFLSESDFDVIIPQGAVIVDCIFGSGLNREVDGWIAQVIGKINLLPNKIVSIDIPSGLWADRLDLQTQVVVEADVTLTIQTPKRSMLFPENHRYVGEMIVVPIGLDMEFHDETECRWHFYDEVNALGEMRRRSKFDHKGNFGHLHVLAGSKGMMGAALLSAYSSLRSGVGKVTAHVPKCGLAIMQTSVPEVMCTEDHADDCITSYQLTDACTALCIGPGIGKSEATAVMLENVLKHATRPCVFDADALNLIATHHWLTKLPKHSIITPHVGEFDRLFGVHENNFARLTTQIKQSQELKLTILMKGAHSIVTTPEGEVFFNSTGNPGMATAGSGDVLSGIIGSLLAQGYASQVAARLGAFIHGLAGNAAEELRGSDAMIARDMIEFIGDAFMQIHDLRDLIA